MYNIGGNGLGVANAPREMLRYSQRNEGRLIRHGLEPDSAFGAVSKETKFTAFTVGVLFTGIAMGVTLGGIAGFIYGKIDEERAWRKQLGWDKK